jgi:cell shape-determining protein MreC
MARSLMSSNRLLPLALAVTVAASLLPGGALGWTKFPAEVLSIVIMPFADVGNRIGYWLRPLPAQGLSGADAEIVQNLQARLAEFERLYFAEQAKVEALETQLQQLQGFPSDGRRGPVRTLGANVGARARSIHGEVTLNRGSKHGVQPGAVAVCHHVHLLGRVTNDVSTMQCRLLPLTNVATGPLRAKALSKHRPASAVAFPDAPSLHLEPRGDGMFIAEPHKTDIINVGDEVILNDPTWPHSAQGMKIGVVKQVRPNDRQPLRSLVIVEPEYLVSQVSFMVLRVEDQETGGQP